MNLSEESPYIDFWLAALAEPIGIAIQTDNRRLLSVHLYKARNESDNQSLFALCICFPKNENELYIAYRLKNGKFTTKSRGKAVPKRKD